MSIYIKIGLAVIVLAVACIAGYKLYYLYDISENNKKITELEQKNKELADKINAEQEISANLKLSIAEKESDNQMLQAQILNNRMLLSNIRQLNKESKDRYEQKISDISSDTTGIYNRCVRMCKSADDIKIGCATDFCRQFSANSTETTAK